MIHKTFYIHFTELTSHNFACIAVLDQKLIFVLKKYTNLTKKEHLLKFITCITYDELSFVMMKFQTP
jgi:hypothetical protein